MISVPVEISLVNPAYEKAEQAIKEYERFTLSLPYAAINQLRYAGFHILKASGLAVDSDDYRTHCRKAIGHCKRAEYDAREGVIIAHLAFLADFQDLCRARNGVETVYPDYVEDYKKIADLKDRFQSLPAVQSFTDADEDEVHVIATEVTALKRKVLRHKVLVDALESRRASEFRRLTAQQFVVPFIATLLGTLVGFIGFAVALWTLLPYSLSTKLLAMLFLFVFAMASVRWLYRWSVDHMLTDDQRQALF